MLTVVFFRSNRKARAGCIIFKKQMKRLNTQPSIIICYYTHWINTFLYFIHLNFSTHSQYRVQQYFSTFLCPFSRRALSLRGDSRGNIKSMPYNSSADKRRLVPLELTLEKRRKNGSMCHGHLLYITLYLMPRHGALEFFFCRPQVRGTFRGAKKKSAAARAIYLLWKFGERKLIISSRGWALLVTRELSFDLFFRGRCLIGSFEVAKTESWFGRNSFFVIRCSILQVLVVSINVSCEIQA